MTARVFIDGAAGTTGLEIRERLAGRSEIELVAIGESQRKDPAARAEALNDADFVILCLPDDAAREAVALIRNDRTRVVDASSAHRVADGWTYGFPELEAAGAAAIATAMRVSNPGCYPTGFLALVRPLVRAGLLPADWPVVVHGTSGYSGGGKAMVAEFEAGEGAPTAHRAYALALAHKHVPEMTRHSGLAHSPIFLPSVADTYRGMVIEVALHTGLMPGRPLVDDLRGVLAAAYPAGLVRVAPDVPAAIAIEDDAGTDRMTLHVAGNDAAGQVRLIATLDNLGKGAGGAAVQNLNIMAGLDPLAGLVV